MSNENTTADDEASKWHNERRADTLRNVESQLNELAQGYSSLDARWGELQALEEQGHSELDTRKLLQVERERAQIQQQASQVQNGWNNLQAEKQRLEQHSDPRFEDLLNGSSTKSQLFLRTFRHKLENDPNALKQLMYADARAKAVGLKPDSDVYFRSLEAAVGLAADDRSTDDFDENTKQERRSDAKPKTQATEAQKVMARNLPGVTEDEYLAQIANPFSQAATITVEPDELNFGQSKAMDVSLDETPKQAPAKYKAPDPKSSVTLSPAELSINENMAVQTSRPLAEVRTEFAKQKLALHSGKTSHMLYEAKLRAEGNR